MSVHLKKNKDFNEVYQNGTSLANKYLVMYIKKNGQAENRYGISVSKKVGNSVARHRIIRLIRESIRLNEVRFRQGFDVVIIARMKAKGKNYSEIEKALLHLGKLHQILPKEGKDKL